MEFQQSQNVEAFIMDTSANKIVEVFDVRLEKLHWISTSVNGLVC